MSTSRKQILLDTDIGTDVDDVVALGLLLQCPSVDLRAVTTVYVNSSLRAEMVHVVLERAGRLAIPIGSGIDTPLLGRDPLFWIGFEGEGLLAPPQARPQRQWPHAVDLIVETVLASPGAITLLAIGPLTNIAAAIRREPRLISLVERIVIMGGLVQRRADQLSRPYVEHNIRCDPEAAQIVLTSGAPITLVPLDVTTQVFVRRGDLQALREGAAIPRLVADQIDRYMDHMTREQICPHDALAAAAIAQPDLLRTVPMRVCVETAGQYTRAETVAVLHEAGTEGPAIDVALEVDAPRFEHWLLETLARAI